MELKRDLLRKGKKSVFRIVLGIVFLLISIAWIAVRFIEHQSVTFFDWFYAGIMFMNGVVHATEGFGFSFASLTGKAFIHINSHKILLKKGVFFIEQGILWSDIKRIDYKLIQYQIVLKNEKTETLDISKLEYSLVKEIKETISFIAKEKGIAICN
jgi:hypothetical protein